MYTAISEPKPSEFVNASEQCWNSLCSSDRVMAVLVALKRDTATRKIDSYKVCPIWSLLSSQLLYCLALAPLYASLQSALHPRLQNRCNHPLLERHEALLVVDPPAPPAEACRKGMWIVCKGRSVSILNGLT